MVGDTNSEIHMLSVTNKGPLSSSWESSDTVAPEDAVEGPGGVVSPKVREFTPVAVRKSIPVTVKGSAVAVEHWLETNKAQLAPDLSFIKDNESGAYAYIVLPDVESKQIKELKASAKLKLVVGVISEAWGRSFTDEWMELGSDLKEGIPPRILQRLRRRLDIKEGKQGHT
ncbi:hypothetical protein AK830_g6172 [Neonectria ditissima]|uniref:Uncharacterized protein n=1 Tax=Neonectria ditissima TaxID=78410 RepID=A0A0P7B1P1_9HYPO|nr:hypothetical protein AK830_g6172 [Neonectria ditissima]